jgi:hypothetical protein
LRRQLGGLKTSKAQKRLGKKTIWCLLCVLPNPLPLM